MLGLRSGLRLLQHRYDLFFTETLRFHCPLPLGGLYSLAVLFAGGASKSPKQSSSRLM